MKNRNNIKFRLFESPMLLFRALLDEIKRTLTFYNCFNGIIIPGGKTPMGLYSLLNKKGLADYNNYNLFLSDERYVSFDSPDSNYRNILATLNDRSDIRRRIVFFRTDIPVCDSVNLFSDKAESFLNRGVLSLSILGLGVDGHTASIFSDDDINKTKDKFAIHTKRPDNFFGLTISKRFISCSRRIIFIANGKDKKDIINLMLIDEHDNIVAKKFVNNCNNIELWYSPRN